VLAFVALVIVYSINNRAPKINIPTHTMPAVNARDDFMRAANMARNMRHKSPSSWPNGYHKAQLSDFQATAVEVEPIRRVLRQGFSKPYVGPSVRSSVAMNFPEYASYREMARALSGAAEYYERVGQPNQAVDLRLDCIEMGQMMPGSGAVVASLVGNAVSSIGTAKLEEQVEKLSQRDLAVVARRLERTRAKRIPYSESVLEDGYVYLALVLEGYAKPYTISQEYKSALEIASEFEASGDDYRVKATDVLRAGQWMVRNKQDLYEAQLASYREIANRLRQPYRKNLNLRTGDPLLDYMVSAHGVGWAKSTATEAVLEVLRTKVALLRYRADHSRFPNSLAALAPKYLPAVPVDPFGLGQPLRYKPLDGGKRFLLYSVGANQTDEGGKPMRYVSDQNGDTVAGHLSPKRKKP
jgi:hypothetical protein